MKIFKTGETMIRKLLYKLRGHKWSDNNSICIGNIFFKECSCCGMEVPTGYRYINTKNWKQIEVNFPEEIIKQFEGILWQ